MTDSRERSETFATNKLIGGLNPKQLLTIYWDSFERALSGSITPTCRPPCARHHNKLSKGVHSAPIIVAFCLFQHIDTATGGTGPFHCGKCGRTIFIVAMIPGFIAPVRLVQPGDPVLRPGSKRCVIVEVGYQCVEINLTAQANRALCEYGEVISAIG